MASMSSVAKRNNKSKALASRHGPRAPKGDASINIRIAIAEGTGKAGSRIMRAWSDTHLVKPVVNHGYNINALNTLLARPVRFNPVRPVNNVQTLRVWDAFKRKFVAKRVQIGKPGSVHQPASSVLMYRGDPTLFDDCTLVDPKHCDGVPRCVVKPGTVTTRKTGVLNAYHVDACALPVYRVLERKPTALKIEADTAVAAYRAAVQLAYVEALIAYRSMQ